MPDATQRRRRKIGEGPPSTDNRPWDTVELFPIPKRMAERGPLPKQRQVIDIIRSGAAMGGGIVFQGAYGASKTIILCTADILCHLLPHIPGSNVYWEAGYQSLIARETYPRLQASTWQEYKQILARVPKRFVANVSAPTKNSMGVVEWADGGTTLFISLSDENSLASANLGMVGIDEGHLQLPKNVEKADDRNRHTGGPRVTLITKNPAGHDYAYEWAHPKSVARKPKWHWIESSIYDNPELTQDYIDRLEAKYKPGTLAWRRWCKGEACPLEGSAFGDLLYPDLDYTMHLLPGNFPIPKHWPRGRGLDFGIKHWTVVVWGAYDPDRREWYIYRAYRDRLKGAEYHAKRIVEMEQDEEMVYTPASPEMWGETHAQEGAPMHLYSTAQEFLGNGCWITQANHKRQAGLNQVWELLTPYEHEYDEEGKKIADAVRLHPYTNKPGRPRMYFLDRPDVWIILRGLEGVMWPGDSPQMVRDRPDDVVKTHDDEYDALRYLVMEEADDASNKEPVRAEVRQPLGTRGYLGYQRPERGIVSPEGEEKRTVALWTRDEDRQKRRRSHLTAASARARRDREARPWRE